MDSAEFAARIKAKYPQYADMADEDLARKMVAKFPDQYSDVTFASGGNVSGPRMALDVGRSLYNAMAPAGMKSVTDSMGQSLAAERYAAQGIGQAGKSATDAISALSPLAGKAAAFALPQDEAGGQATIAAPLIGEMAGAAAKGTVALGKATGVNSALSAGAQAMLRYAESKGIQLTAADIGKSKFVASLENLLEKTPLGSDEFRAIKTRQVAALRDMRDYLSSKFGTSEDAANLGSIAQDAVAGASQAMKKQADVLYGRVGELAAGKEIPMPRTVSAAADLLDKELALRPELRNQSIIKAAADTLGVTPESLNQDTVAFIRDNAGEFKNDFANWSGTKRMLGNIIERDDNARALATPGVKFMSSAEAGAAKMLNKTAEQDFAAFSATEGGELKKAHDVAGQFYKDNVAVYNDRNVRRLLNSDPERVVQGVFRPGAIEPLRAVKAAAGGQNSTGWQALRKSFVEDKLLPEIGDNFTPDMFQKALDKYGEPTLREIFTPKELMEFKGLARVSSMTQQAARLQGTQGSARTNAAVGQTVLSGLAGAGGMVFGGPVGASVGVTGTILGPKALSKLYLSDVGRNLLLEGIRTPSISPKAAKVAAEITSYLAIKAQGGTGRNP